MNVQCRHRQWCEVSLVVAFLCLRTKELVPQRSLHINTGFYGRLWLQSQLTVVLDFSSLSRHLSCQHACE